MRKTCLWLWVFCLSGTLATAQSNESAPKLTGILGLPDVKLALIESPGPPRGEGLVNLGEGERRGRLEVLAINAHELTVEAMNGGKRVNLRLEPTTEKEVNAALSCLRLSNANLQQVLDAYGRINSRTVLQHPALRPALLSLDTSVKNWPDAIAALERLFEQHGIASIRDGAKFVLVIPAQMTNTATAPSNGIVPRTTENGPALEGTIYFENAELPQALAIYGRLVGRKLVKAVGLPTASIRLRPATDLTRAEAAYALETLFRWNGVKVVPIGDTEFQALPILPGNRK